MKEHSTFGRGFVTMPRMAFPDDDPFTIGVRFLLGSRAAWDDWEDRGVPLRRGQILLSRGQMARLADWTRDQARHFLEKLVREGWLKRLERVGDRGTIYEIVNYDAIFGIRRNAERAKAGGGTAEIAGSREAGSREAGSAGVPPASPVKGTKSFEAKPSPAAPDDYHQSIATLFRAQVQNRPLKANENALVDAWYDDGIVVSVVLREIENLAERERRRGRGIRSLRYFDAAVREAGAVDRQHREDEEQQAEKDRRHIGWLNEQGIRLPCQVSSDERLENLAGWLARVPERLAQDDVIVDVQPFCDEILALRGRPDSELYDLLDEIDDRLFDTVRASLHGEALREITERFNKNKGWDWSERACDNFRRVLLRETFDMPQISLLGDDALHSPPALVEPSVDKSEKPCHNENRECDKTPRRNPKKIDPEKKCGSTGNASSERRDLTSAKNHATMKIGSAATAALFCLKI